MASPEPIALLGVHGSPYTRKMLALLRYRRIPYRLIVGGHRRGVTREGEGLPAPKVNLLPTFYFRVAGGGLEAVVDSTPILRRLEREHVGRSAIPDDPAIAFLDYLLEDYADEWLTKAMFHYRWHYQADMTHAGEILPRWSFAPQTEEALAPMKSGIAERQISRLYVVGSNETTTPVIEASYERFLDAASAHLEKHAFLMGGRPGGSDFAVYGQLTQLAKFDPTPMALTFRRAPRVYAWVDVMEDLSGLEPNPGDWLAGGAIPDSLRAILAEVGRVYAPALLANARALASGANKVETEIDGRPWVQDPFPYQGRCLQWLREERTKLDPAARRVVDDALQGSGCEALFI